MGFTRIVLFYCTIRYHDPAKRANRFVLSAKWERASLRSRVHRGRRGQKGRLLSPPRASVDGAGDTRPSGASESACASAFFSVSMSSG